MNRPTPSGVDDALLASVRHQLAEHARTWSGVFDDGRVDPEIKDLCARFLAEEDDVVAHAEDPERYDGPRRAALAWAQAIGWNPDSAGEELWAELRAHFSEPELVELGTFISLELGRRNWLRTFGGDARLET